MVRQPERREVLVLGLRISYLEWGSPVPGQPSMVILHGLLAAAVTFDRVVDDLDPDLHVLALDLPGNGHSERNKRLDTSTRGLAAIVAEFIRLQSLDRPILYGHSHGGLLALRLLCSDRDALSGLVLVAPAHPFEGYREKVVQYYLKPFGRTVTRLIFPHIPSWLYLYFFRQMPGTADHFDQEVLEPYLHSLRRPGTVPYTLKVLHSWHDDMDELRADLESEPIRTPTLVLWGEKDMVVPSTTAPDLLTHFTAAEFVTLPTAGHLPNEEAPAECARLIQSWIDSTLVRKNSRMSRAELSYRCKLAVEPAFEVFLRCVLPKDFKL